MHIPAHPFLQTLLDLAAGPLSLVGGTVRDLLLGIPDPRDIDIVMQSGSDDLARTFADSVGGSFFSLDEERKITRVVKHGPEGVVQFDFADYEGPDLAADLRRRDFTVNAMALDLRRFLATGSLDGVLDPFGGREDVRLKQIRVADPRVLEEDPLRMLRAVRFAATLGFRIEQATAEHIRARAGLAAHPSPERIRDELFLMLAVPGADRHLGLLDALGLLQRLIPELGVLRDFVPGRHHEYDILTHSFKTAGYVDAAADAAGSIDPVHAPLLREHLNGRLEQSVTRMAALRFASLLHDVAKADTFSRGGDGDIHFFGHDSIGAERAQDICRRLRLSNDTTATVGRLVRNHMRPLNLSSRGGPSRRALYRYCRDVKDAVPESVLLSLADAQATREVMPEGFTDTRDTARRILEYYYDRYLRTEEQPFVNGRDLIERGLRPGPEFREILDGIRERQAEGTLKDRREALEYLDGMRPRPS